MCPFKKLLYRLCKRKKKDSIFHHFYAIFTKLGWKEKNINIQTISEKLTELYTTELFWGLDPQNAPCVNTIPQNSSTSTEVIISEKIPLITFCEHHLLPMYGYIKIAYLPQKDLIGFSTLEQLVAYYAARPQLQERLTQQILDTLKKHLKTEDIAVVMSAKHFCTMAIKTKNKENQIRSIVCDGAFKNSPFFELVSSFNDPIDN